MTAHQLRGLQPGFLVLLMAGLSNAAPAYAPPYYRVEQRRDRARVNPYYAAVPRRLALAVSSAADSGGGVEQAQGNPFAVRGARRR